MRQLLAIYLDAYRELNARKIFWLGLAFSAVVVYLLTWWIVIFCVLPLDIESIKDAKETGNMPGAPVKAGLKRKFLLTTIIATVAWAVICLTIIYGGISFHDVAARMAM